MISVCNLTGYLTQAEVYSSDSGKGDLDQFILFFVRCVLFRITTRKPLSLIKFTFFLNKKIVTSFK